MITYTPAKTYEQIEFTFAKMRVIMDKTNKLKNTACRFDADAQKKEP